MEWNKIVVNIKKLNNVTYEGDSIEAFVISCEDSYVATVRYEKLVDLIVDEIRRSFPPSKELVIIKS